VISGPASRLLRAAALLLAIAPRALAGQDSQFGISGLGTPGRSESVRGRATAGALAPFDALSALADAALAAADKLTVTTGSASSYRSLDFSGERTWLRATRFPILGIAGPLGHGIMVGGGFTTYLDKSYAITTRDTVMIRGAPVPVTDRFTSDGAVSDLRAAVAARLSDRLSVGAGVHLLTGSTRVRAAREFGDSAYASTFEAAEIAYDGFGVSAGVLATPVKAVHLAAFLRSDTRLRAREGGLTRAQNDLPTTVGGGVAWQVGRAALLGASVVRQSWSSAGADAYDVVNWSVGGELGRSTPLRLGVRGGRMPFGPGGRAPREFGIAGGTGARFSEGRGIIDLTLEHLSRSGVGLRERVWTLLIGVTVRP
jgi:hypothetical protein